VNRSVRLCPPLFSLVCLCGYIGPLSAQEQEPAPSSPGAPSTGTGSRTETARQAPQPASTSSAAAAVDALIEGREIVPEQGHDPTQAPARTAPTEPLERGFVVGASLGMKLGVAESGVQPILQPGLALGGKIGRVVLTLGAEFTNQTIDQRITSRAGANTTVNESISSFLVVPGIQVAMVRSRDARVELLGSVRLGIGAPVGPPIAPTFTTSRVNFMFELAPGVRYWAHRHFALSLLAGFRGDYLFQSTSGAFNNDPSITSVVVSGADGVNGIFATIGGLGAF
jgi:hypothetical protein